ncbi:hypothetical protein BCF44_106541 [Kutzneria buriramensis]|uniref:HTH cro/C1-type domain-containing protein n=1 Tax=Kutzneria buriramensis TaxID=1045776 RepID=A0A3E0HMD0_9PSEU|nr:hypothetical protein BCF44_106541 [Kutzneria buriramensis]
MRVAAGLSQTKMAERLGMTYTPGGRKVSTGRAAVSAWEKGRRRPTLEQVQTYIDMGADPAIMSVLVDSTRESGPAGGPPSGEDVPGSDQHTATPIDAAEIGNDQVEFASAQPQRTWLRRRWRWLAAAAAGVAIAVVVAFSVLLPSGGPAVPATTWTETTGTPAHTWADPVQLTGAGTPLGPRQSVQVLCRVRGYVVQDGDPWWYRLASPPWNGRFYATSDAFYNNGTTSGSVNTGVVVDEQLPVCDSAR